MRYRIRYSPSVRRELSRAVHDFLVYHQDAKPSRLYEIAEAAFEPYLSNPHIAPNRPVEGMPVEYRRVIVWHFVFLFRIDATENTLEVERIFHERSEKTNL